MNVISAIALHITESSDLIITNNQFIRNRIIYSGWHGDAISVIRFVNSSNIVFSGNIVEENVTPQNVVFIVDESNLSIGTINIEDNKIKYNKNRAGALVINNLSNTVAINIYNNQISYNSGINEVLGSYEQSAGLNIDGNNITVRDNVLSYNESHQGGGLFVVLRGEIAVEENKIFRNTAICGGGMYIMSKLEYDSSYNLVLSQQSNTIQKFESNVVFENVGNPGALYVASSKISYTLSPLNLNILQDSFYFLKNSFINNRCLIQDGEGVSAIQVSSGELALINCLTVDNEGHGLYLSGPLPNKPVVSINSVFWNNSSVFEIAAWATSSTDEKSYFYNSIITNLTDSIDLRRYNAVDVEEGDPMFVDRYFQDYHITNPYYGTVDAYGLVYDNYIGLYPYDFSARSVDGRILDADIWHYVSFPKLDRDADLDDPVLFSDIAMYFEHNGAKIYREGMVLSRFESTDPFINPPVFEWNPVLVDMLSSKDGFIIMPSQTVDLSLLEGKTLTPNQKIDLRGGQENWIGYFLNRTVTLFDAFSLDALDNIEYIKTKDGGIYAINDGFISSSKERTISFGDMAIIKPYHNMAFKWETGRDLSPAPFRAPILFEFTTLPKYSSIFIEVDPQDIPAEIAVYVNDVCKGASIYEGDVTEVLAYLDETDINQEIEIVYGYYTRAPKKLVSDFALINLSTRQLEYKPLIARNSDNYYHIKHSKKVMNSESITAPIIQLHQNYPNPFNPQTNISFYLSIDDSISLSIYNIRGQKVRDLYNGTIKSGMHSIVWNGKDKENRQVSSGVYFYKLNTTFGSVQKKMLLLK